MRCMRRPCPEIKCINPIQGECCMECRRGCLHDNKRLQEGDVVPHPKDPCMECVCQVTVMFSLVSPSSRVVMHSPLSPRSVALLKSLHWLPVHYRIIFKMCTIALSSTQPAYLNSMLTPARNSNSYAQPVVTLFTFCNVVQDGEMQCCVVQDGEMQCCCYTGW